MGWHNPFAKIFGVHEIHKDTYPLLLKFFTINALLRMITNLTSTVYILYFFDNLGFQKAGIVIAVGFFVQSLFDFPTGVLSDKIGQKRVLLIAFCGYIISLSVLSYANSFYYFLIANVIYSLSVAQESGAMETWFDNKYKKQVVNDTKRKNYGDFIGKASLVSDILGSLMLLVGGYLVLQTSRAYMFRVQAFVMIFFTLFVYKIMEPSESFDQDEPLTFKRYAHLFKKGVSVIFSSGVMFFFIVSIVIYGMTLSIFGDFVMFPAYRGFVANDFQANAVRFSTWIFGTIFGWIILKIIKHLEARDAIPRISLFHDLYLFAGFALLLYFYPIKNTYVPIAAIIAILMISSTHAIRLGKGILLQRMYLDLIPDDQRNSFYSLMPTLTSLITAPFAVLAGYIAGLYGHYVLMMVLGSIALVGSMILFLTVPRLQLEESSEVQIEIAKAEAVVAAGIGVSMDQ